MSRRVLSHRRPEETPPPLKSVPLARAAPARLPTGPHRPSPAVLRSHRRVRMTVALAGAPLESPPLLAPPAPTPPAPPPPPPAFLFTTMGNMCLLCVGYRPTMGERLFTLTPKLTIGSSRGHPRSLPLDGLKGERKKPKRMTENSSASFCCRQDNHPPLLLLNRTVTLLVSHLLFFSFL